MQLPKLFTPCFCHRAATKEELGTSIAACLAGLPSYGSSVGQGAGTFSMKGWTATAL